MIKSISIANFKAFADEQKIPIKPITLIFGPNSSGKSSILHSLIFLNEAIRTGNLDVHKIQIGGDAVDLGGFGQMIYKKNLVNKLMFKIDIKADDEIQEYFNFLKKYKINDYNINISITCEKEEIKGSLFKVGKPYIDSYELLLNKELLLSVKKHPKKRRLVGNLNTRHPIISIQKEIDELNMLNDPFRLLYIKNYKEFELPPSELELTFKTIIPSKVTYKREGKEIKSQYENGFIENWWSFCANLNLSIVNLNNAMAGYLSNFIYLGPLRYIPERNIIMPKDLSSTNFAEGEYAWELIMSNDETRKKVNLCLKKLGVDYQLSTRFWISENDLIKLQNINISSEFEKLIFRFFNNLKNNKKVIRALVKMLEQKKKNEDFNKNDREIVELKNLIHALLNKLNVQQKLLSKLIFDNRNSPKDLILIDLKNDTEVNIRDVGIGISQLLPIIVYCYAFQEKFILIEQPEIHLHPRLQAELGDVFIDSALGENKNTFIIETHSEHLILRIMRRIRESTHNKLPTGIRPLRPEDVCILFVEPFGEQSIVREMELNANGELIKSWPGGFFEEGLKEILS